MHNYPLTRKTLGTYFDDKLSTEVQAFFSDFTALNSANFKLEISLAYIFFRLEQGQRQTLYCGARKIHKTDSELTWRALNSDHISRSEFKKLFETIYDMEIAEPTSNLIAPAEKVRDKLMHGKEVKNKLIVDAVARTFHYVEEINTLVHSKHKFKPFGSLKGFVGAAASLDKSTTRWILKGMGFSVA